MNIQDFTQRYHAEYISSRSNPRCMAYSKLADKKYRDKDRLFLCEGIKLTEEALGYCKTDCVIISESKAASPRVIECAELCLDKGVSVILASDSVFEKISTEKSPEGVIAVVRYQSQTEVDFNTWQCGKKLIILDEVRDPGNLGAIIRSSEAFGMDGVVLSRCADPYSPRTVRAAMGSLFRIPLYITDDISDCITTLRNASRRVLAAALSNDGLTLGKYKVRSDDCVIIGNEGHGISDEIISMCDKTLMIPMFGQNESLNASIAASCIMWEYARDSI